MKPPIISTHFLSHLDEMVLERGGNLAELIESSGLPGSVITEPGVLIPFSFHLRLLDLAADKLAWPTLGLELATRQSIEFMGPIYPMIGKSPDVRAALKVFSEHLNILVQGVTTRVEENQDNVSYTIECNTPRIANNTHYQDHSLALLKNMMSWLCGPSWQPRAVYFPRPESDNDSNYSVFFKAPVAFNSDKLRMIFERKYMDNKLDSEIHSISRQLRELLEEKPEFGVTEQVKFMILTMLPTGHCNTAYVAEALGQTHRTLQRRLEQEGTSFKAILNSCRLERAKIYLSNKNYRMSDISSMLGFADQSGFTRSFHRWFKISPKQWRNININIKKK